MRTATGAVLLMLLAAVGCAERGVELEFRAGHAFSGGERQTIRDIAERAVVDARRHLPALPRHLRITVQAGSHVIPETGETGGIGLPDAVYWTVDPAHDGGVVGVANAQLRATLLHEWYHLVREAKLPTKSLVDRAVSEGLATAFERDVGGRATPWGAYPPKSTRGRRNSSRYRRMHPSVTGCTGTPMAGAGSGTRSEPAWPIARARGRACR